MVFKSGAAIDNGNQGRIGIVLAKSRRRIIEREAAELMLV
jgi:hypothetical protein